MTEPPYLTRDDIIAELRGEGIAPPRLYAEGFPHNNCGGFCIKAGQGHFAHLLRMRRASYLAHEAEEASFGGHTILRDRTGGETKPLSLRTLRERIEAGRQIDLFDIGGCGCFSEVT